jgi:hypothetical protein
MSDADFLLLGGLFGWGMGHHDFIYSQPYYDNYIHPAYVRYPGYVAYGYRHQPVPAYSNVNVYKTTVINYADTKHATEEKTAVKDPKFNGYKTANGKTISADKVPAKAFSGTNVTPRAKTSLGDAPSGKSNTTPRTSSGTSTRSGSSGSHSSGGHGR